MFAPLFNKVNELLSNFGIGYGATNHIMKQMVMERVQALNELALGHWRGQIILGVLRE